MQTLKNDRTPTVIERQGDAPTHITPLALQRGPATTVARKAKATGQGKTRSDAKVKYGPYPPASYAGPNQYPNVAHTPKFRFAAIKSSGAILPISSIDSVTWDDANAILTGTLDTRDVMVGNRKTSEVELGDRILCEVDMGGGFRELWTMRTYRPQIISANDGTRSFDLANDLDLLRQSEDWFYYKADKAHPHGWLGHEIVRDICNRYNVTLGGTYVSTLRMQIMIKQASPLEAIRNVMLKERRKNGRRLFIRYDGGRLYVLPLQRSASLLALGPTLMDAAMKQTLPDEFASAVTMRGIGGNGPQLGVGSLWLQGTDPGPFNGFKGFAYQESAKSIARFGFVHKIFWSPDAKTQDDLQREAMAFLNAVMKPIQQVTLTHRGIPSLRRGDAIYLAFGDESLRKQICWVYEVQHQLTSGGVYVMTVTVIFEDPFVPTRTKLYFRLKPTEAEALGNRKVLNPMWWIKTSNKADATDAQSPEAVRFNALQGLGLSTPGVDNSIGTSTSGIGGAP